MSEPSTQLASGLFVPAFPAYRAAKHGNPQTVTYYGAEHIGKSEAATKLPGRVAIIELQPHGGDHLAGQFLDLHEMVDAGKFGHKADGTPVDVEDAFSALVEKIGDENSAGRPIADFVVFDRIDRIEDWVFKRALKTFRQTLIGKSEKFADLTNVTDVPGVDGKGSPGWRFVREEMRRIIGRMQRCAPYVVFITGMRDKNLLSETPQKAGNAQPTNLDLTGGLRKLVCNESSSFGFMYRNEKSDVVLNFRATDTVTCGTYCKHLRGKELVIGKVNAAGETIYDWSAVYLNEPPTQQQPQPGETASPTKGQ